MRRMCRRLPWSLTTLCLVAASGAVAVHAGEQSSSLASRGLPSRITTEYDHPPRNGFFVDGISDGVGSTISTYDALRNLVRQERASYTGPDPATRELTNRDVTTWEYDSRRNVLRTTWEAFGYGTTWYTTTQFAYDAQDRVVRQIEEYDTDGDGAVDLELTTTYTYATHGNRVLEMREVVFAAGYPVPSSKVVRYTHDQQNRPVGGVEERDYDSDGTVDARLVWGGDYGGAGAPAHGWEESDYDGDGILESRTDSWSYFDGRGNLARWVYQFDQAPVGTVDSRLISDYTWDQQGRLVATVENNDWDPFDGLSDDFFRYTYEYDGRGNLVRQVEVTDWFADGVIDYLTTYAYAYDERGNRLSTREESGSGGRPLGGRTRTFEYDQHNNLVREFEEVFTSRGVTSRWWGRYEY